MPETLYVITRMGFWLPVTDVTALAFEDIAVNPGDYWRNDYLTQSDVIGAFGTGPLLGTEMEGDTRDGDPLRDVEYTQTFWKFTRGASLPIVRHKWSDVMAICSDEPNRQLASTTNVLYLPLRNGVIAVYSGVSTATTDVVMPSDTVVFPGDFYRNIWFTQSDGSTATGPLLITTMGGDILAGSPALNSESWTASHIRINRSTINLYAPLENVVSGPATRYPNRTVS
jgi:hypothetical protein